MAVSPLHALADQLAGANGASSLTIEAGARLVLLVGEHPKSLERAAAMVLRDWAHEDPPPQLVIAPPARSWPFRHPLVPPLAPGPVLVWAPDLHAAFVNHQQTGTHLVTTQAGYLGAEWLAALTAHGRARLLATARAQSLRAFAPDVLARRGVWRQAAIVMVESSNDAPGEDAPAPDSEGAQDLAPAFGSLDPAGRLRRLVRALETGRTAPALVATASVCMEVNDLSAAARDLDEAIAQAPGWAAAHFERGKLYLRSDDMVRASHAFRAAAEALPEFGPAWANLGATLGELDRTQEALEALERAQACDPTSHQTINNIGVLRREMGRLAASESAFGEVIRLAPEQAFGYYNLGHTLFLQGRYRAALSAYGEGQARDADRNPVQATRLALCRLATGDSAGVLGELQRATATLPRDYRRHVLADTTAILWALVTQEPDLAGWQPVQTWLSGELERLA